VLPGDLLPQFAAPFTRLGLAYMITGGAAAIVYGVPRLTNDPASALGARILDRR